MVDCHCGWKQPVELVELKDEFNEWVEQPMTVGYRYSNEGQKRLDRLAELRDILGLWNGEMVAK